jgi:hypothetical protein
MVAYGTAMKLTTLAGSVPDAQTWLPGADSGRASIAVRSMRASVVALPFVSSAIAAPPFGLWYAVTVWGEFELLPIAHDIQPIAREPHAAERCRQPDGGHLVTAELAADVPVRALRDRDAARACRGVRPGERLDRDGAVPCPACRA